MKNRTLLLFISCLLLTAACKNKVKPIIQTETGANKEYVATRSVKHVDWAKNATIYEVNIRQYTKEGTLKAFEKHLPRLKALGIDILWLMPINPISEKNRKGSMGSYYAVQDYKKVNPEFGTDADFKAVVDKAHQLGMRVILDWVPNHTGWDNVWIKQHPEWYTHNKKGEIISPNPDWTDVADLNYDNKQMRAAMIDALKYWVEKFDIDGYRCDVAGSVPTDFWNDARKQLDAVKPVFMLAEAWEPQLSEYAFDMVYGWDMHHAMNAVAQGKKSSSELYATIQKDRKRYADDTYEMQFITNHDENSWNGTEMERMGKGMKTFAVLSFTIEGMPLIYSGQEVGMNKRLKFFEKDEIKWIVNKELTRFYQTLTNAKHQNKALWNGTAGGKLLPIKADKNADKIVAFSRKKGSNTVIVILNVTDKPVATTFNFGDNAGTYTSIFSNKKQTIAKKMQVKLKPWEYRVLVR